MSTDKPIQPDVVIATPWPEVRLGFTFAGGQLVAVEFLADDVELFPPSLRNQHKVVRQFEHYFSDPSTQFELDLALQGTPFQQRVWRALCQIPSGQTLSYGELAQRLGSSARAVGNACRANRLPVVIPCHRVVAKSGLGGFMGKRRGSAINIKQKLLLHERGMNARQV